MERELFSTESNLYSHPTLCLDEHLKQVFTIANYFLQEKPEKIVNLLQIPLKISCCLHDIGKATRFFQEYLAGKKVSRKDHSLLSAICVYFVVKSELEKCSFDTIYKKLLPILSYIVVKQHHGNLKNITA
ncbi:MAG: CRISPR-associated endonuclease Cas3'', partial [Candidatus Aenigmarchaeota archaeon]|nr:CRISPR-associated endonuclease Cas3'' [Candidatus Aenigmarchaeota archaeon]MDW8149138.1 CRISPR-associated endonuclease Cas3'' [Candidatus Aenigmarchaeota archaeon]